VSTAATEPRRLRLGVKRLRTLGNYINVALRLLHLELLANTAPADRRTSSSQENRLVHIMTQSLNRAFDIINGIVADLDSGRKGEAPAPEPAGPSTAASALAVGTAEAGTPAAAAEDAKPANQKKEKKKGPADPSKKPWLKDAPAPAAAAPASEPFEQADLRVSQTPSPATENDCRPRTFLAFRLLWRPLARQVRR
jgi:hypothetical protein